MKSEHQEWVATHTGWLLFAPILLADLESDCPVPIPRFGLWRWFEANLWAVTNLINPILDLIEPDSCGYLFWGVRELNRPQTIAVPEWGE